MIAITRTKIGTFTLGAMLIITGLLLDSSSSLVSQALHHVAFITGGVWIGIGIKK
jgi:hypothetical protein